MRSTLRRYRHSMFGNATMQLVARVYTATAQLVAFYLVGAAGSDRAVAAFSLGMAACGLVSITVDAGSGLWIVRRLAGGGDLPRLLVPRVVAILACAVALVGASFAGIISPLAVPWVLLAGATLGCGALWRGVLWSRLKYGKESMAAILQGTIQVTGVAVAVHLAPGNTVTPMVAVATAFSVGYLARVAMARRLAARAGGFMGFVPWFKEIYSYFGLALVVSGQTQGDLLLLGTIWNGPVAGVAAYGLAMRFYYSIGMPFESLGAAVIPRVAMRQRIAWARVLKVAVPIGILLAAAWLVVTSEGQLFGLTTEASSILKSIGLILAIALPFRFTSYVLGGIVTGSGRQSSRFIAATLGLTTMLTLDLILIPLRGPIGASAALVCADVVLMLGYAWATRRAFREALA